MVGRLSATNTAGIIFSRAELKKQKKKRNSQNNLRSSFNFQGHHALSLRAIFVLHRSHSQHEPLFIVPTFWYSVSVSGVVPMEEHSIRGGVESGRRWLYLLLLAGYLAGRGFPWKYDKILLGSCLLWEAQRDSQRRSQHYQAWKSS